MLKLLLYTFLKYPTRPPQETAKKKPNQGLLQRRVLVSPEHKGVTGAGLSEPLTGLWSQVPGYPDMSPGDGDRVPGYVNPCPGYGTRHRANPTCSRAIPT